MMRILLPAEPSQIGTLFQELLSLIRLKIALGNESGPLSMTMVFVFFLKGIFNRRDLI